jgi:hypothetical protein
VVINCPVCGKLTCIHWPEHWIHRRGPTYYCSDNCLQVDLVKDTKLLNSSLKRRKSKVKAIVNEEQRKHAVEIALSGGDPRPFLSDCGSKNPEKLWSYIKICLRKTDPVTYDKLPARIHGAKPGPKTAGDAMNAIKEAADNFFDECDRLLGKDEPDQIETPETPKRAPLQYDGYTVCCIESKTFGRFYWDRDHNHLDWTTAEGEEVSFTPTGWKMFLEELPKIAAILGVEL